MALIIPKKYKQKLLPETTEIAIKSIKDNFQVGLAEALNLRRITAPLFVLSGTGLNDDLNGTERPVSFPVASMNDQKAEVVHSLASRRDSRQSTLTLRRSMGLGKDYQ